VGIKYKAVLTGKKPLLEIRERLFGSKEGRGGIE
jgi:hypothetical protein